MLKQVALFGVLFLVLLGFGARPAFADIYQYVNDEGVISFADNLESVPEKYRATVINTTARDEQKLVKQQPQTEEQKNIAAMQEALREESALKMTFTARLFMTAVVIIAWFGILIALNKKGEFKNREKILPAIRISLACVFLIYLVMVHGKDVVRLFTMAGNKIETVQEKQAQRGKKAGQAIKALNNLMEEAGKQEASGSDPGQE